MNNRKIKKKKNIDSTLSERVVELILTRNIESLGRLTEEKIAETLEISPTYLLKIFETDQRISLSRFILREKIRRAFFILEKDHTISIEELSRKLGFRQTNDFSREFKKFIAIEPTKFKNLKNKGKPILQ